MFEVPWKSHRMHFARMTRACCRLSATFPRFQLSYMWHDVLSITLVSAFSLSNYRCHIKRAHMLNKIICLLWIAYYRSSLLATTSADQSVKLWSTSDFSLVKELTDPKQRWVWDCAFSGDSQYLITGEFAIIYGIMSPNISGKAHSFVLDLELHSSTCCDYM